MKAIEFLKQNRVYEDETIYNSVGEIVGTVSQLMEEYAALRQPLLSDECEHPYHSVLGDGEMQPAKCLKCGKVI